jgi:hypothetical protein
VEEDVRQLMDGMGATLITAIVTLVVGGPVAYVIGLAQSRRQRLEERRAEVIAELFRHVYVLQDAFFHWSYLNREGANSRQVVADRHAEQGKAAIKSLNDLKLYFYSNEPWLFPSTSARVKEFIELAESIVNSFPPDLKDIDFLQTEAGRRAAARMTVKLPGRLMDGLIQEFRTVLYPPPWYDRPLRALKWLEKRARRNGSQE